MKCILMNKNTEVLIVEYFSIVNKFSEIYEIVNIDYAPLVIKNAYEAGKNLNSAIEDWFTGRGIPSWRDDLSLLLDRLSVSSPDVLLDKAFALSLSDQYWLKPFESKMKYEDINFFENNFNEGDFIDLTFSNKNIAKINETSLKTPNNTTDGILKKAWIIENEKRYLLKGGLRNEVMQPFNEVLASMICKRLGFNYIPYEIDILKEKIVSKCECFINPDTELITAYQVLSNEKKYANKKDYEKYIKILKDKNIKNARKKVENMLILDFLMMNEDRHLNNFGIIRNVNTLEWIDVAPIFDTGQSLNIIESATDDEIIIAGQGRLFYEVCHFDNFLKRIKNIKRIDVTKLDGVVEEFEELLSKYQDISRMTDRRIIKLCYLLNNQINKLKEYIINIDKKAKK